MTKEIQEILKLRGWTQKQLGDELGVHESTIYYWAIGGREPGKPAQKLLRQILDKSREEAKKQTA